MIPEPTIAELLTAGGTAIRGVEKHADLLTGSDLEVFGLGPNAVIWSRQAQRDTDLFDRTNFNTAEGKDLTRLAWKRFRKARILDSRGQGTITLERASTGIEEPVRKGTRILVLGGTSKVYRVRQDTTIASGSLTGEVPIEAMEMGTGTAVSISDPTGTRIRITDALLDTWKVTEIECADGTAFEKAETFRNRIRTERVADRVGHEDRIVAACADAGADNVILFQSDFAGDAYDVGMNVVYVGNSSYEATPELVKACTLALWPVRVAGAHLQVLPMEMATFNIEANVYLIDVPGKFNLTRLETIHSASLRQYMNGDSGQFSYSIVGLKSAILNPTAAVRRVEMITPTVDHTIVEGSFKSFPHILQRLVLADITLNYLS